VEVKWRGLTPDPFHFRVQTTTVQPGPPHIRLHNSCGIPRHNGQSQQPVFCRKCHRRLRQTPRILPISRQTPLSKNQAQHHACEVPSRNRTLTLSLFLLPKPFFFYSTLTDPLLLQEVLQLSTPPILKPARVKSYKIMLWGQYPAMVDGPRNRWRGGDGGAAEDAGAV
jgi:hypothetical protein